MKRVPYIVLMIIMAFGIFWFFPLLRSVSVMSAYSAIHENRSIMKQAGFSLNIPGGISTPEKDWYSFPMTFNAGEFTEGARMSIIYNFPAFDGISRSSRLFDEDSPYNSAFYGAYVIKKDDGTPYGLTDNELNTDEVAYAFEYDYVKLVLKSLGNEEFYFSPIQYETSQTDYLGFSDWIMVDAVINTNGTSHNSEEFRRSYIQYGNPRKNAPENFPPILLVGRLYIRYFEEYNCTIAMYIMARREEVIIECDKNILSK
ncbi:MAG: hypothetical protein JW903_07510, partial [Clostridia bacterium]|nr:hypothetical protein [Clostridia bacterium]